MTFHMCMHTVYVMQYANEKEESLSSCLHKQESPNCKYNSSYHHIECKIGRGAVIGMVVVRLPQYIWPFFLLI
jgi:hypothetical protein